MYWKKKLEESIRSNYPAKIPKTISSAANHNPNFNPSDIVFYLAY
ncbi:MAG: hypothetical protein ACI9GH_000342 [Candidatus Paceibacteria bacterium]|jgi:hypothetical protein